ncbi:toll/interleukin-1 receptor domain-containing protein [Aeromonas caviae]|uniref:toll/interleukin-1 receptor domain-containing protein n=1 Tax=Aeromonas caviae TaxID=648 RepID=UPI001CF02C07|nr:toll/interleukin-1 receptor domain-containing protein [Aeromonas caviae]UCM49361.1 toll/interleukin-1 receptor domain-containing protein [Aeromonas caviae]
MKKVWITYSWLDNDSKDVEFIAQQIEGKGFEVRMDRWDISAGRRLWEQIDTFISRPEESDAWIFYATQNSLGSEPCKEEFAYALQRSLSSRSESFPLIGLFPSAVEKDLIPAGVSTRLYVSLEDQNWLERLSASIDGHKPNIHRESLEPFFYKLHETGNGQFNYVFEVRPRAGNWAQPFVAIPSDEVERTRWMMPVTARVAGSGRVPMFNDFSNLHSKPSGDKKWFCCIMDEDATPSKSIYLYLKELPSSIVFGSSIDKNQQFDVTRSAKP